MWRQVEDGFKHGTGQPRDKLRPIVRSTMSLPRCYAMVRGTLTTAAAQMGRSCGSAEEGAEILQILHDRNGGDDTEWERRWEQKARKIGTYDETVSFSPFE